MHTQRALEVISVGPSAKQRLLAGRGPMPQDLQKNRRHPKSKHGSFHQTRGAKGAMQMDQRAQLQRTSFWPHRRKFINQRSASVPSLGQSRDSLCNLNTWSLPALRSQTGCNVVDTSAVTNADFNSTIQISTSWFRLLLSNHSIAASWAMRLWRLALTPKSLSPTLEELLTLTLSSSTLTSKSLHIWKSSLQLQRFSLGLTSQIWMSKYTKYTKRTSD